ncbi:hypothetical protein [Algiphilus sp.]|uniref:hypothetical protein n=1 Tax=Algiphilus sp. TaxID=1872431 RepID=UPI003C4B40CB
MGIEADNPATLLPLAGVALDEPIGANSPFMMSTLIETGQSMFGDRRGNWAFMRSRTG